MAKCTYCLLLLKFGFADKTFAIFYPGVHDKPLFVGTSAICDEKMLVAQWFSSFCWIDTSANKQTTMNKSNIEIF